MIKLNTYFVDAFTNIQFKGNPAAVFMLNDYLNDVILQKIATEINYSESVFLNREENNIYNIRWFTPKQEVPLCGHGTLAASKIIFDEFNEDKNFLIFKNKENIFKVTKDNHGYSLIFPNIETYKKEHSKLNDIIGYEPVYSGEGEEHILLEFENEDIVKKVKPVFSEIKEYTKKDVYITAKSNDDQYDFKSRVFAPGCGIDEDPVTGSAHCALGPYWAKKLNKQNLRAMQISERTGVLDLSVERENVIIKGQAVKNLDGFFYIYD